MNSDAALATSSKILTDFRRLADWLTVAVAVGCGGWLAGWLPADCLSSRAGHFFFFDRNMVPRTPALLGWASADARRPSRSEPHAAHHRPTNATNATSATNASKLGSFHATHCLRHAMRATPPRLSCSVLLSAHTAAFCLSPCLALCLAFVGDLRSLP